MGLEREKEEEEEEEEAKVSWGEEWGREVRVSS